MNKGLAVVGALLGAVLITASSCAPAPTSDRSGGNGKNPDHTGNATNVVVFLNADNVPNVALFCIGPYRFASTLSGGDDGVNKASALVRLAEDDAACGKPQ